MMLVKFVRKRMIRWYCPSNSNIGGTVPFSDYDKGFVVKMDNAPQQGDFITYGGKQFKILRVTYDLDNLNVIADTMHDEVRYVTAEYDPMVYVVPYYRYMEVFTTDKFSCGNVIFPTTWTEWQEDIEILEDIKDNPSAYTEDDLEKLKLRRCVLS